MPDVQRLSSHPSVVKTLGDLFTPPPSLTHFESLQLSLLDSSANASCRVIDGSQEGASRSGDGGSAGGLQLSLLTGGQVRYIYLFFYFWYALYAADGWEEWSMWKGFVPTLHRYLPRGRLWRQVGTGAVLHESD